MGYNRGILWLWKRFQKWIEESLAGARQVYKLIKDPGLLCWHRLWNPISHINPTKPQSHRGELRRSVCSIILAAAYQQSLMTKYEDACEDPPQVDPTLWQRKAKCFLRQEVYLGRQWYCLVHPPSHCAFRGFWFAATASSPTAAHDAVRWGPAGRPCGLDPRHQCNNCPRRLEIVKPARNGRRSFADCQGETCSDSGYNPPLASHVQLPHTSPKLWKQQGA